MVGSEFLGSLVSSQKAGSHRGIASVCSAHRVVLEAAFVQARHDGLPVLIESTVNQVNQFGGYTGMTPAAFRDFASAEADRAGCPRELVILGGDHLGPYPWRSTESAAAMRASRDLVAECVSAGYGKIHLDASMPLGGDPQDGRGCIDPALAAEREAELAAAAEAAFVELHRIDPRAVPPAYVIGTEVPVPGGVVRAGDPVGVTSVNDFNETVALCADAFRRRGMEEAWSRVCAVVAQPGVEFGDQSVHAYDRSASRALCAAARAMPGIVLEGHSTDYQTTRHLRELVEDGVAILKVGPALTFALRECLFSLERIEEDLLRGEAKASLSNLSGCLEEAMLAQPAHWRGYYTGSEADLWRGRRYGFSDRCRYYWSVPSVSAAVDRLMQNLRTRKIPLPLISQHMPLHYAAVREGRLAAAAEAFLVESVRTELGRYSAATRGGP